MSRGYENARDRRIHTEHHVLLRGRDGRLYIEGVNEISPLDKFRSTLARTRTDALVAMRRRAQARAAGGDQIVTLDEAAAILGYSIQHTRKLFRSGLVLGAYREGGRWWVRRRHLWSHTQLGPHEEVIATAAS